MNDTVADVGIGNAIPGLQLLVNLTLREAVTVTYAFPSTHPSHLPPASTTLEPLNAGTRFIFPIMYALTAVVGGLANLVIIVGITSYRQLWKPTYFYILNASVSDFLICAVCCPFNVYASIYRSAPVGCEVVGAMINVFMIASLISLSAVALNRYMLIKLSNDKYKANFMCHRIILSVVLMWLISTLCLIPLAFDASKPGYDTHYGACLSSSNKSNVLLDSLQAGIFGFPSLFLIYYCYAQIWRVFRSSVQSVDLTTSNKKRAMKGFKLSRNLFVVTTIYTVCWLPSFLLMVFDREQEAPSVLHQSSALLAVSHSMINPITYLLLNRNLSSAYASIFLGCRRNSDTFCCGCMFYCLRGQALPSPSSTGTGRARAGTLRKISNQLQVVLGRTRSTTLRKTSEPTPSTRLQVPAAAEPARRVSEPPPTRKLSIVSETLLLRPADRRQNTRRTATFSAPSDTQVLPFTSKTLLIPTINIQPSCSESELTLENMADSAWSPLDKLAPTSDLSTSDSGCEMIPLHTFQTTAEVSKVEYEAEGPKRLKDMILH